MTTQGLLNVVGSSIHHDKKMLLRIWIVMEEDIRIDGFSPNLGIVLRGYTDQA